MEEEGPQCLDALLLSTEERSRDEQNTGSFCTDVHRKKQLLLLDLNEQKRGGLCASFTRSSVCVCSCAHVFVRTHARVCPQEELKMTLGIVSQAPFRFVFILLLGGVSY